MSQLCNPCLKVCDNKTEYGYCRSTACINPNYNGAKITVSDRTISAYPVYNGTKQDGGAE